MDNLTHQFVICYNCNTSQHCNAKVCTGCGAPLDYPSHQFASDYPSQELQHGSHVFQVQSNEVVFSNTEVVTTPSSSAQLLENYSYLLHQLEASGFRFYSVIYNPQSGSSDVKYTGISEEIVASINETLKPCFPKPAKKRQKSAVSNKAGDEEKKYSCPHPGCDYHTKYSWHVKHHMRQHTGEKPYHCNICSYRSADKRAVRKHKLLHQLNTPFKCQTCSLSFSKERGLNLHMTFVHGKKAKKVGLYDGASGKWKCQVCDGMFSNSVALMEHQRTHTGEKPYACDKCAYRASHTSSLKIHMKNHENMESKALSCKRCSFRTDYYSILGLHIKNFHPEDNIAPETSVNLKAASKRVVKHRGPWKCQLCDIETATRKELEQHRKKSHIKKESIPYMGVVGEGENKTFHCKMCKFTSSDQSESKQHSEKHMVRNFACDLCPYKTISIGCLNRHKLRLHKIIPVRNCSLCNFTCESMKEFNKHKKTHDITPRRKVSPLVCSKCYFTTSSRDLFDSHMNSNCHEVSFTCDICSFTVDNENELELHQQLHKYGPQTTTKAEAGMSLERNRQLIHAESVTPTAARNSQLLKRSDASKSRVLKSSKKSANIILTTPKSSSPVKLSVKVPVQPPKLAEVVVMSASKPSSNASPSTPLSVSPAATTSKIFTSNLKAADDTECNSSIMQSDSETTTSIVVKTLPTDVE